MEVREKGKARARERSEKRGRKQLGRAMCFDRLQGRKEFDDRSSLFATTF